MAKNQRQRRPLQDETRQSKQTVRERSQASRRQRDRIEENRDRREQRRERNRLRRQTVDSIRSPKEDIRLDRLDSRLVPIEDTFLGQPVGSPTELPVVIGERWFLSNSQSIDDITETAINFTDANFTTERNGYPSLYQGGGVFRVPAGLRGIWYISAMFTWTNGAGVFRAGTLQLTDNNDIAFVGHDSNDGESLTQVMTTQYLFSEGDEFELVVYQDSGGALDLLGSGGGANTWIFCWFIGK